MDISIIIPVYNEENNLNVLFKELKSCIRFLRKEYEIIFINDGSIDNSGAILDEISMSDKNVKVIHFDNNYGQTAAIDAGLRYAKGDYILSMDADLQYKTEDAINVFLNLKYYDAVFCSRVGRRKADGFIKAVSSKIAYYVRNKILRENFSDICSLRGFRRDCLRNITLYKNFEVFIPSLIRIAGFRIKEIKINSYPRKFGRSKYNISNRLWKGLIALFVVKWMQNERLVYRVKKITEG